jgi:ABC-type multidrug transport system ATPase subunit
MSIRFTIGFILMQLSHFLSNAFLPAQDDVIMATQTVTEALSFAAALKMNFSPQMRSQKVSEMLALLGLSGSENTIIGDSSMKGVSGGERKRVAVGMQLITDPSLLFLDEPTSGLDTLNAFNVVSTLKKLALKGKTVVATLHQPSSEIFHMIDDLIVMAAGEIVYCGPANAVVSYFATLGFNCPMYSNPADFIFMDVLNLTKQAELAMSQALADSAHEVHSQQMELSKKWSCSPQNHVLLNQCHAATVKPISGISTNFYAGFTTQFAVLMQRAWKNALRNPLLVKAKIGQAMFMAVLLGLIYQGDAMKTHQAGIQNRTGVLFFMSINQVMSAAIGILSIFFAEKLVFMRENASGM